MPKSKILAVGDRIRLCPIEEAVQGTLGVNLNMRTYFGNVFEISSISAGGKHFRLQDIRTSKVLSNDWGFQWTFDKSWFRSATPIFETKGLR